MHKLMQKLGAPQRMELLQALKGAGGITTWYETVQYSGKPIQLTFELWARGGLFSKRERIAAGIDRRALQNMARYISNNSGCHKWRFSIKPSELVARSGDFMILERTGMKDGDREAIGHVIKRFGGDAEDIDYLFNASDDRVLGYLPGCAYQQAENLALVVHTGATRTAGITLKQWKKLGNI